MKGMAYNGWKHGLPDKFWPVTLDNFFDDPDEVRELGLRMLESDKIIKSSDEAGNWPGYRSENLREVDGELCQKLIEKIMNCYFNLDLESVFWNYFDIRFQSIPCFDKDKNNVKNKGWIHRDGTDPRRIHHPINKYSAQPIELAGLIYLTPDIEPDAGTSLFNMKKDQTLEYDNLTGDTKHRVNLARESGDPINDEEVKEVWERHRSCFIEKIRFANIYNRLIMYDNKEFHGVNSYYTSKDNRLTLAFFINGIKANKWPLERIGNI